MILNRLIAFRSQNRPTSKLFVIGRVFPTAPEKPGECLAR